MEVTILKEAGYDEAALGFSLSYNTTVDRAKEILGKFAFGIPGENKFLESIYMWLDVTAPRFWWQEADTYRLSTKQSGSTMHTLVKRPLEQDDFEYPIPDVLLGTLNSRIYNYLTDDVDRNGSLAEIKGLLPEGFLQRRVWVVNYKCMQNIITQRSKHRLPQWRYFCGYILDTCAYPELLERKDDV